MKISLGVWFFILAVVTVAHGSKPHTIRNLRVDIDEPCSIDPDDALECTVPNSECVPVSEDDPTTTTCQCDPAYESSGSTICRAKEVGQGCTDNEQCSNLGTATCEGPDGAKVCECTLPSFPSEDLSTCHPQPTEVGDECKYDPDNDQCEVVDVYSRCEILNESDKVGLCECDSGYVFNTDKAMCVASELNVPCIVEDHCVLDNSVCDEGEAICICVPNFFISEDNSTCIANPVQIDDPCISDEQCYDFDHFATCQPNGVESDKLCKCDVDYTHNESKGKCVATKFDITCEDNTHCDDIDSYAECKPNSAGDLTCQCQDKYSANGDVCQANLLFTPCMEPSQCSHIVNSDCRFPAPGLVGLCECVAGTEPSPSQDKCWVPASQVGGPCESGEVAQCGGLGDPSLVDCVPFNETASDPVCMCKGAAAEVSSQGDKCLPIRYVYGADCVESSQCHIDNTACKEDPGSVSKCLCDDEFIRVTSKVDGSDICVPILHYEGVTARCEYNEQCVEGLGEESRCDEWGSSNPRYCMCNEKAKYLQSTRKCHLVVPLDGTCTEPGQCQVGVNNLANCTNERCTCNRGTITWEGSCYEAKTIGSSCGSHVECTISIRGGVLCDPAQKKCTCDIGYFADYENTVCTAGVTGILRTNNLQILTFTTLLVFVKAFLI